MERYYGNYRAKVIDNKDPDQFGQILVWIPDHMPTIDDTEGIWAKPANNPVGGRNDIDDSGHHYSGSSYIPLKGSWIWIFYEGGNPNRPFYFGSLDLENTKVLPENQLGSNYELKWTIFKSHAGRCIVISDDEDDERVEITSKKRKIKTPPTGDLTSVYEIDGNQTTILLDERNGKEKVLIRTHKGDFLHVDIDERQLHAYFKSDIHIKTDENFYLKAKKDIHIKTDAKMYLNAADDINIKTDKNLFTESTMDTNIKSTMNIFIDSTMNTNINALMMLNLFGTLKLNIKSGMAVAIQSGVTLDLSSTLINVQSLAAMNLKSIAALNIDGMAMINIKTLGLLNTDGSINNTQMGLALPALPALPADNALPATAATAAIAANPIGERDT